MALPLYLAMTAAEVQRCGSMPRHMAWMACHFSSYGTGLSNLPRELPEDSLLILNDRIPVQGHDPTEVAEQLARLAEDMCAGGVLLDFQRPHNSQTEAVAQAIADTLTCPLATTESYAAKLNCAVFPDAPRAYRPLKSLAEKWKDRELWLEASYCYGAVTVTEKGSHYTSDTPFPDDLPVHREEKLHCSYCIDKTEKHIRFHFKRTTEDLNALLEEAETLGITRAIGLYQELFELKEQIG